MDTSARVTCIIDMIGSRLLEGVPSMMLLIQLMKRYFLWIIIFGSGVTCLHCGPGRPSSPDVTPSKAAEIISSSLGFNRYRQLVSVEKTAREGDSMAECCYNVWFTLRLTSSGPNGRPIPARAELRYIDGAWHLNGYDYGDLPNMEIVWVVHDGVPHN